MTTNLISNPKLQKISNKVKKTAIIAQVSVFLGFQKKHFAKYLLVDIMAQHATIKQTQ